MPDEKDSLNEQPDINQQKPAFLLFQKALQSARFAYFQPDNSLKMTESAWRWIYEFTKEYYYRLKYHSRLFEGWKRFFFQVNFRMKPSLYPALIYKESMSLPNLSQAVPGNPIDKSMLIGYFIDLRQPDGRFFENLAGGMILPFAPLLQQIQAAFAQTGQAVLEKTRQSGVSSQNDNDILSSSLLPTDKSQDTPLENMPTHMVVSAGHALDCGILAQACSYIAELFSYCQKNALPHLRSGHLVAFISGLYHYSQSIKKDMTEYGLTTVKADGINTLPLHRLVIDLEERLSAALNAFALDLVSPALDTLSCRMLILDGQLRFEEIRPIPQGALSRVLNWLFDRKKKKTEPSEQPLKPAIVKKPVKENNPEQDTLADPIPYIELHSAVKGFVEMMKASLAPDTNDKNEVLNYKQGFDQFDIPEHARTINYGKVILEGRIPPGTADELSSTNAMVIKSTYWLYDRLQGITRSYRFSKEGTPLDQATHFVDDIKSTFTPSKKEYNEIRTYGIFPQFQINILRIFNSKAIQKRFTAEIEKISTLLDKAVTAVRKEERKRKGLQGENP